MVKKRAKLRTKNRQKSLLSRHLANIRGSSTLILLVAVVIAGSIAMAGGIFPSEKGAAPPPGAGEVEIDTSNPSLTGQQNSLQLKTLKFKQCDSIAAVDFLVDNSGSMAFGSKMQDLKNGLLAFSNSYPNGGLVGLQVYSDPFVYPAPRPTTAISETTPIPTIPLSTIIPLPTRDPSLPTETPYPTPTPDAVAQNATTLAVSSGGYAELVPISKYSTVKSLFKSQINAMYPKGGTYSKNAMEFAKEKILAAKAQYPNYQFNLIFISDGIPETLETNRACPGGPTGDLCSSNPAGGCRCFDQGQNPKTVANEIKNSGVRIFTIAYVDSSDQKFNDRLQSLMKSSASAPGDYYQAPVSSQISSILSQIAQKLCK